MEEIRRLIVGSEQLPLIDQLLEVNPGRRAKSVKNVSVNEPFFAGHFPGQPVLPGVLILEAMRQTVLAALAAQEMGEGTGTAGEKPAQEWRARLRGVDEARFRRPVLPGDRLVIEVELGLSPGGQECLWSAQGQVDGEVAAEAVFRFCS
ncbi:MAG: 3-hydroxyacyl-ACP dehydratase FabZ [Limnochordaceae bacterium]|nr:3-hydroxyacyl-ACP dehydratase FabZ [Limnochordaceae bacterium]